MRYARVVTALALFMPAVAGAQVTVYSNNFDSNTNGVTGPVGLVSYPSGCASAIVGCSGRFLGAADGAPLRLGQSFAITLSGLATHTGLTLDFDYLSLQSMDGSAYGPDGVLIYLDGNPIFNHTFSNWPGNYQDYCPPTFSGFCAERTGADENNTLGYTFVGDAVYQLALTVAHTNSTAVFSFTAYTNQDWTDEGMGFDNISVTAEGVETVPEPASMVLLATGLAGVFGVVRRTRRAA